MFLGRWIVAFALAVGFVYAAAADEQSVFQFSSEESTADLVDLIEQEARQRNIPLDHDMASQGRAPERGNFIWSTCGVRDFVVRPKDITVRPDPPQRGHNLTVHALASTSSEIAVRLQYTRS
jgi:hypothetical protein